MLALTSCANHGGPNGPVRPRPTPLDATNKRNGRKRNEDAVKKKTKRKKEEKIERRMRVTDEDRGRGTGGSTAAAKVGPLVGPVGRRRWPASSRVSSLIRDRVRSVPVWEYPVASASTAQAQIQVHKKKRPELWRA